MSRLLARIAREGRRGDRVVAAAELFALVLAQLWLLRGFPRALDLHPHDEVAYFARGLAIFRGDDWGWMVEWGPFYSVCYALLDRVPLGRVETLDAMFTLVAVGSTVALWWALRGVLRSPAAFLLALWWAASPQLTNCDVAPALEPVPRPMVNAFGMMLQSIAIGCVARRHPYAALPFLGLLFLTRPESVPIIAAAGALMQGAALVRRRRELLAPGIVWLVAGGALIAYAGQHEGLRARSWFNFGQNYAVNSWSRAGQPDVGPSTAFEVALDYERWIRPDFPTAVSISEAARENPREFLAHVEYNVRDLPRGFEPSLSESFESAPWLRGLALAACTTLCLAGLLRRDPWAVFARCPLAAWPVLAAGASVLPALLVMNIQDRFVLPMIPGILALVGCAMIAGWERIAVGPYSPVRALALPAAVLALVALLPPLFAPSETPLVHRISADLVRALVPDRPMRMMATNARAYLDLARKLQPTSLNLESLWREPVLRRRPFAEVVEKLAPDVVLETPLLEVFDQVHAGMRAELDSQRWIRHELRPGFAFDVRAGADPDLLDLARLEALRAPGGALAGFARPLVLEAAPRTLPISAGGAQSLRVRAGVEHAGRRYVLFGALPSTRIGPPWAALFADPYFQVTVAGGGGLIAGASGRLDESGEASARFVLPAGLPSGVVGARVKHAYAVLDDDGRPLAWSSPAPLELVE